MTIGLRNTVTTILKGVVLCVLLAGAQLGHAETGRKKSPEDKKPPNVLFIAIDDMNDWTTLFDKDNPIKTPNLERLAARGCFFSRAYCAAPGCNPSRTAILTGLRPTTSGVYSNGQSWKQLLPDVVKLPQHFQKNGYIVVGHVACPGWAELHSCVVRGPNEYRHSKYKSGIVFVAFGEK